MSARAHLQSWISRQWQKRGVWAYLAWPLAWVYGRLTHRTRQAFRTGQKQPYRAPVPVIVIGNIYVGGTGKTPLACAIGELLMRQGWHPGLVSRGYGRTHTTGVATGQGENLDWREFGDEPALIAQKTGMPVSVHPQRAEAAKALLTSFPQTDIIISDDGLQHYRLARDFEILVQDERGLGNGLLLPAGPLREPAARLEEVDWVISRQSSEVDSSQPAFRLRIDRFWQPATGLTLAAQEFCDRMSSTEPVAAIAGIGVPARFFASLADIGITVHHAYPLADHAAIDFDWLGRLPAKTILITEKDAVKMPGPITDTRLWVAQTTVQWWREDAQAVLTQLLATSGIKRSKS